LFFDPFVTHLDFLVESVDLIIDCELLVPSLRDLHPAVGSQLLDFVGQALNFGVVGVYEHLDFEGIQLINYVFLFGELQFVVLVDFDVILVDHILFKLVLIQFKLSQIDFLIAVADNMIGLPDFF